MRILVDKRTASLFRPRRTPRCTVVICLRTVPVGDCPLYAFDVAERAVRNHFFDFFVCIGGALIIHNSEKLAWFFCRLVHFDNLFCVNSGRFLGDNVKTVWKRHFNVFGVVVVRNCNNYNIAAAVFIKLLGVVKTRNVGIKLFCGFKARGVNIADCAQFHIFNASFCKVVCVSCTHIAEADNSHFQFAHFYNPPNFIFR